MLKKVFKKWHLHFSATIKADRMEQKRKGLAAGPPIRPALPLKSSHDL
jgi:hypothetical protein